MSVKVTYAAALWNGEKQTLQCQENTSPKVVPSKCLDSKLTVPSLLCEMKIKGIFLNMWVIPLKQRNVKFLHLPLVSSQFELHICMVSLTFLLQKYKKSEIQIFHEHLIGLNGKLHESWQL